ncbi:hypothetical protein DACRYDRAFT_21226 [Dacryopinax primogenitus]|uniref:Cytochrome c oxidase assembly protein n=1 Tax=Dacryopinax primogenitus (strain DJM 731) TaxID=1858805 RepID=M5G0K7_DACPD|nr:uncharacterized protein DACRYDRAFT_21226 [Dacryopinax primogenitus]EJU03781.1 hypothetical protein DACRYDRAFT_21226 [Dacryopinax primogenitus]
MASRASKITFIASIAFAAVTVWGVHYMQDQERESMYQGVLKDEARVAAKRRQREQLLLESQQKREIYEGVQPVSNTAP